MGITASYPLTGLTEGIDPVIVQGTGTPFDNAVETARDVDQDFVCHEDQRLAFAYNRFTCAALPDPFISVCEWPLWWRNWGLPRLRVMDPLSRVGVTVLSDRRTLAFNDLHGNLLSSYLMPSPIVGGLVPNRDRSTFVACLQDRKAIDVELVPLTLVGTPRVSTILFPDAINWPPARDAVEGLDFSLSQGGTRLSMIDSRHGTLLQTFNLPSPAIYPPVVDYKNQVASVLLRSRQRAIVGLQPIASGGAATMSVVAFYSPDSSYPVSNTVYDPLNLVAMNLAYDPNAARYAFIVTDSRISVVAFKAFLPAAPLGQIFNESKSMEAAVPTLTGKVFFNLAPISYGIPPVVSNVTVIETPWRYLDGADYYHRWQVGVHGGYTAMVIDDYHHTVVDSIVTLDPIAGPPMVDSQNQYAVVRTQGGYLLCIDLFKRAKGDPSWYRYDFFGSQASDVIFDPHAGLGIVQNYTNVLLYHPRTGAFIGSVGLPDVPVRPLQFDPHNRVIEAIMPDGSVYHVDLSPVDGTTFASPSAVLVNTGGVALAASDVAPPAQPVMTGISISSIGADGIARVQAPAGCVEPNSYVALVNSRNRSIEPNDFKADSAGGFDAYTIVATGDTLCIVTADVSGNVGPSNCMVVTSGTNAAEESPAVVTMLRTPSPNPAWGVASIEFSLAKAGPVRLDVHDIAGRLVRTLTNEDLAAGWHTVRWDGTSRTGNRVSAGIYYVRLVTDDRKLVRPLVRLAQ